MTVKEPSKMKSKKRSPMKGFTSETSCKKPS